MNQLAQEMGQYDQETCQEVQDTCQEVQEMCQEVQEIVSGGPGNIKLDTWNEHTVLENVQMGPKISIFPF